MTSGEHSAATAGAEAGQGYRMSIRQQELWCLSEAGRPQTARATIDISGAVDEERLRAAVLAAVGRHESLHTVFRPATGHPEPLQVFLPENHTLTWDPGTPIHLAKGPVMRACLDRHGAADAVLVIETSALHTDAESMAVLLADIVDHYAGSVSDDDITQYLQFSEWQHEATGEAGADRAFWRGRLASIRSGLRLPHALTTSAGPPPQELEERVVDLSSDLVTALNALAGEAGTGIETLLFSCWALLLARLTGQRTLTLGFRFSGRDSPELNGAVGPFCRSAPITLTIRSDTSISDLLSYADGLLRDAGERVDHLPFMDQFTGNGEPVLPVGFAMHATPDAHSADDVRFAARSVVAGESASHLTLCGDLRTPDRLRLLYHPGHLSPDALGVLADQLVATLTHAVTHTDRPAMAVELCTPQALQLIGETNDTDHNAPQWATFVDQFVMQAARVPERIAVSDGQRSLTYHELDVASGRLAAVLRDRGIGPESLVALCHEPATAVLVGILGIARAGGAWLPIDVRWPAHRVRAVLTDAMPVLTITQESLLPLVADASSCSLCLDHDICAAVAAAPVAPVRQDEDSLAYVIYTSGSTGTPKGVAITHGGLNNYLTWARDAYELSQESVSLVHSPLSFDLTLTALLVPLMAGGQVRFAVPPTVEGLVKGISDPQVTLLKLTPAHLSLLSGMTGADIPARTSGALVVGGEALTEDTVDAWRDRLPGVLRVNEYGPTETVVGCCTYQDEGPSGHPTVPIGRPIRNTRIHLLDEDMNRVGIGLVGEIFIGGAGVARGYHGRADLTADRFVPDPFGTPGGRLYRTGDLARYLPDGNLEYLGRNDSQVQVQGFRVELGEVESALNRHEDVVSSAVAARGDGQAAQLNAYVTLAPGPSTTPAELRGFLRERLPAYLVPATVTVIDALPLTANGKVDRARLPDPAAASAEPRPRRALSEQAMAECWAETLEVAQVGHHETFFDLGGTSFLLVALVARLQQEFAPEITVLTLLEHPTVAGLVSALGAAAASPAASDTDRERAQRQRQAIQQRRQRSLETK
jgi:amino acid adenylation domain-containing protein